MKFAICQELFVDWPWERQCEFIAETGYQGIEVAPFTLGPLITDVSANQRKELRQQATDAGLEIIGLHWLLAKTEGLYLTSPDPAVRKLTSDYLIELGHACADLGGDLMVLGSPLQRNLLPGVTKAQANEYAIEVLAAALPELEKRGVRICLEPLTSKETDFINTCAEAMDIIERIGAPNLCLHQDVKAMLGGERESIPALIEKFAGRVGHFHANDSNLLGPGMGDTDFAPIFDALARVKYEGWVSVEVFDYSPGAEKIARDSITYMQRMAARNAR